MAGPGKGGGRKLVLAGFGLAILAGLLAYLGAGAGPIGRVLPLAARGGETEGQPRSEKASPSPATCRQLALEPLVVNLAEAGSRRYLRVTVNLEYADGRVEKDMERLGYRVRDALIQVLRAKTVADLAPDRAVELRRELLSVVNGILGEGKVTGLYFQEFIIQ